VTDSQAQAASAAVLEAVAAAMRTHRAHEGVQRSATAALWSIAAARTRLRAQALLGGGVTAAGACPAGGQAALAQATQDA
jgi:hypothetical protein